MQVHSEICQRDDGAWSLGWHDDAPGPFASRTHAEAVARQQQRETARAPNIVSSKNGKPA